MPRRVELNDEDIATEFNEKAESFKLYPRALDESNDMKDAAQILIFTRGINDRLEITAEFFNMESLKGKLQGEDLYNQVSAAIRELNYLGVNVPITKDGSPNITGNNVGLLNCRTTNSRLWCTGNKRKVNYIIPTETERELFYYGIK